MKRSISVLVLVAMLAAGFAVGAEPIRKSDGQFAITGTAVADETSVTVVTDLVQLLGTEAETGSYLVYTEGKLLRCDAAGLSDILPYIDVTALKSTADFEPIEKWGKGDGVRAMQEALKTLGYLTGSADGVFGGQSEKAIVAFQTDCGLEQTGGLDAVEQMLLFSMASAETVLDSSMTPRSSYGPLEGRVGGLDAVFDSGYSLSYDAFDGKGFISNGNEISYDASGAADIDQAVFTLKYGFDVSENAAQEVTVAPAIKITCLCARRPVMQYLVIKAGDRRFSLPVSDMTNTLEGIRSVEGCTVVLSEEAAKAVSEAESVQMRIEAKYQTFDIPVDEITSQDLIRFAALAKDI